MSICGHVAELWRYPVKSMLGELCQAVELDRRGLAGDRLFAVQDENGKIGSGKDTRRFRRIDGLFSLQAHFSGQTLQIKFPDGTVVAGDDPVLGDALAEILGLPVQLVRETDISHLDAEPVHLVTHGSLALLSDIAPEGVAAARRFRPNIVLSTEALSPGDCPAEQTWLGKHVRIGEAELKFCSPTERCGMVTFAQNELLKAPQVLRYITQELDVNFGVYAVVVKPGVIRVGDIISEVSNESDVS